MKRTEEEVPDSSRKTIWKTLRKKRIGALETLEDILQPQHKEQGRNNLEGKSRKYYAELF